MTTQEIVSKLWNLCNVLRDDGITYHQYVTELTYILFLKMAKETGAESQIPEAYRWDNLTAKSGIELKKFYKELLNHLGENCTGRVREIYQGAATNIDEPKNLEKIITTIDGLDWFSAREEGLGNLYEGLLEKNANEKKSGAGQYFTPRVLIDVMTRLVKPQPGERCNDPACGTFGFMIAAHQYVAAHTDDFFDLDADTAAFERTQAFTGTELVHDTHRLALMNAMLHDMEGEIILGDTLSNLGKSMRGYDVVLTNPPLGFLSRGTFQGMGKIRREKPRGRLGAVFGDRQYKTLTPPRAGAWSAPGSPYSCGFGGCAASLNVHARRLCGRRNGCKAMIVFVREMCYT